MVTTRPDLVEPELSKIVFDAFYAVYRELGYGYLERVYENALMIALRGSGVDPVQHGIARRPVSRPRRRRISSRHHHSRPPADRSEVRDGPDLGA